MRLALAIAFLAAATPAPASSGKPEGTNFICHKTGERVGGLKKTCYYECGAWEGGLLKYVYDHCPSWTVRWKLNRNMNVAGASAISTAPSTMRVRKRAPSALLLGSA